MKRAILATSLILASTSLFAASAPDLQPIGGGKNPHTGVVLQSFVSKASIAHQKDGNIHFLLASHFSKPQPDPLNKKITFTWLVYPIVANCQSKMSQNMAAILLSDKQKQLAKYPTGETKLTAGPAEEKEMRTAAINFACSYKKTGK